MKKSLTALFALALAFVFGSATLAYAEAPAANAETAPAADANKDMTKKEVKKEKKMKKKAAKKHKKEMKEETKEGAPAK